MVSTLYFEHRITSQCLLNLSLQKNITYSSDSFSKVAGSPPVEFMGNLFLTLGSEISLSRVLQLSIFSYHSIQAPCHLGRACGQWRAVVGYINSSTPQRNAKTKFNINIEKNFYNYLPCFSKYASKQSGELLHF